MASAGGGRVINIASTAAVKGFKYTSVYCASKHALLGLTRALAVEFAGKNITVNAVCPGWTDTDMLTASADAISRATGRTPQEARKALADMNPMRRLIRPEDVAELCLFLASPAAASVTGACYTMDGGEAV
jgi:NAD(P)-dependent dehydrogenase (short-subunit alcohol dehydrogenase family)